MCAGASVSCCGVVSLPESLLVLFAVSMQRPTCPPVCVCALPIHMLTGFVADSGSDIDIVRSTLCSCTSRRTSQTSSGQAVRARSTSLHWCKPINTGSPTLSKIWKRSTGGRVMLHVPVDDRYAEAMTNEHLTAEESVDLTFVFDASQSLGVDLSGGETTSEAGAAANSAIVVIDVKMGSQVLAFLLGCCCCYCCCCCCCFACPCVLTTLDFAQVWCVLYAPHCFLFEHHHHCSLILLLLVLLVLLPPT